VGSKFLKKFVPTSSELDFRLRHNCNFIFMCNFQSKEGRNVVKIAVILTDKILCRKRIYIYIYIY